MRGLDDGELGFEKTVLTSLVPVTSTEIQIGRNGNKKYFQEVAVAEH